MKTLVWTRGEQLPLDALHERLKCPKCGNRKITVFFSEAGVPLGSCGADASLMKQVHMLSRFVKVRRA
jgi:hypothetical protein